MEEKANPSGGDKKAAGGSKAPVDTSKYALDSKRTFKKSYKGINYKEGKINYYDTFNKEVKEYVEDAEDKIKLLETEYRKDDWSKSIIGIKLQNNKNLFLERNKYYEQHCKGFNENVQDDINKFNNYRLEELEYKSKWDEMVKDLQNTLKKFNIPEGVVCEDDNKTSSKTWLWILLILIILGVLGYLGYKYRNKILSLCREGWITRNNQPVNPPFPEDSSNRMPPEFQSNPFTGHPMFNAFINAAKNK